MTVTELAVDEAATLNDWAPIIIACFALLFTVGSFWWMNWRKGTLKVWPPRSYAATGGRNALNIQLPLVMFNTGPTPIVVRNLRVLFPDEPEKLTVPLQAIVGKLADDTGGREWATGFPVRGREATRIIGHFGTSVSGLVFTAKTYPVEVQGRLGDSNDWQTILSFDLLVTDKHLPQINEIFIAYDNELDV